MDEQKQNIYRISAKSHKKYNKLAVSTLIVNLLWLIDMFVLQAWSHLKPSGSYYEYPVLIISLIVFTLSVVSFNKVNKNKQKGYGLSLASLIISSLLVIFSIVGLILQYFYFQTLVSY